VPSYTNPNNVAIVTATTPDVNRNPGNYYYSATGREVMMMNDLFDMIINGIYETQ
jgi:phosphonoacetate hydrolase